MPSAEKRKREGESLVLPEDSNQSFNRSLPSEFPRGGGSGIAPVEIKRAAAEATNDVFESMRQAKKVKKSKKAATAAKMPVASLASKIEPLSLSKIKVGTLVLGQVVKCNWLTNELVISLPNNLTGFVKLPQLTDHFLNRILRFTVVSLGEEGKHKHLSLSYDPDLVNQCLDLAELTEHVAVQGNVKSVEEKGVILDLGERLGSGFLPCKSTNNFEIDEPILAFVKNSDRRIILLSKDPLLSVATVLRQQALVPGTLVTSAPTEKDTAFGSIYSLLGTYQSTADAIHSRSDLEAVRVLFSYPPTQINGDRHLGVSSLEHVLKLDENHKLNLVAVGDVIEVTVNRGNDNLGLFVSLPKRGTGFVHISQLSNERISLEENKEKYAVGTKHLARVIGISKIDGLAYLSLNPKVIEQKYLSINDVRIGDVVRNAAIDRILPRGGVLVKLADCVTGIAHEIQLSDAAMKNPEQRFKPNQKVSCRVLNVDVNNQRVELTLKKSIVDDPEPILAGYDNDQGWKVGTVFKLVDAGAKVLFFNNVRGLLPTKEMSEMDVDPKQLFRIGQTVKCRVILADASKDKLLLSMKLESKLEGHINEVHRAIVTAKLKTGTYVQVSNNDGDILGDAVLLGAKSKSGVAVGSEVQVKVLNDKTVTDNEQMITNFVPTNAESTEVGAQVFGIVTGSHPQAGVFVTFANNFSGLIPANDLKTESDKWPVTGSVIETVVSGIDYAKNRVFLSLDANQQKIVDVKITAVKQNQLNVTTTDGQHGRIDSSLMFKSMHEIENPLKPLAQFHTGEDLSNLMVVGRYDSKNHKYLPLSHTSGTTVILEISKFKPPTQFDIGSTCLGFLNNYAPDNLSVWINLTPQVKTQVSLVDLSDNVDLLKDLPTNFPIGCALNLKILRTSPKLHVTALTKESNLALVTSVQKLKLVVRLPNHRTADIDCTDCLDEFKPLSEVFKVGQFVKFNEDSGRVTLRSQSSSNTDDDAFQEGQVVSGYVRNISSSGAFISLGSKQVGRVLIKNLSDTYLKNWQSFAKIGDVVQGKILANNNGRIELTLKQSAVTGKKQPNIDNVEVGASYTGTVRNIAEFGVFVDFNNVTGLAHKSEISDRVIEDLARVFKPGDEVKCKVLSKDVDTGRVSLGMKAAYFSDEDDSDVSDVGGDEVHMSGDDSDEEDHMSDDDDTKDGEIILNDDSESEDNNASDVGSDDSGSGSDDDDADAGLSTKFDWSGDLPVTANREESDSESESDEEDSRRKKKRSKKEEFVRDETANLQTRLPQSSKDFERLLVSSPNSSVLWINYIAFEVQLGELDSARSIAKRALKTIAQREEEERMNIWVALLNLEARFGTPENLNQTFRDSQQYMDALTMHFKMATVLAEAGQTADAIDIYKRAAKKFGSESMEVWLSYIKFMFTGGSNKTEGRALAERALQRLPKRLHKDFTRQFALIEYELGEPERARTLFEALLSLAPKRVDLWNVYIDQEIKHGDEQRFSQLFERVFKQNLSMKQAKFFFKKWIGVSTDQEYVTKKAREYVEAREAKNDSGSDSGSGDSDGSEDASDGSDGSDSD